MKTSDYQRNLFKIRTMANGAQDGTERQVLKVLERAYRDLIALMQLEGPDKVAYSVYASRKAAIADVVKTMSGRLNMTTRLALRSTAENAIDIYKALNKDLVNRTGFKYDFSKAFTTVPIQAVRNVTARIWGDKLTFSDRIWKMNKYVTEGVGKIVTSGIARGQSSVDMAKDLKKFLIEPEIAPGTSWTTAVQQSVTGRGTINYNALRLARTEINNTYREALVVANDKNPIMLGLKWNLSARHDVPDVCDLWAKLDQFGRGPGIYPADKTPIDHPNGRCFLTEVLRPASEWGDAKEVLVDQGTTKTAALSLFDDSQLSESQRTAAFNMFANTKALLNSNQRAKAA